MQKRLGNRAWTGIAQCRLCGSFLDLQLEHGETCSTTEATRGHYACVHAVLGAETCAPRCRHRTQRTRRNTFQTSRSLYYRYCRSAALDVCVASPNAAAARRYRQQISDLRGQGILYIPLVWTGDGRPHPAVTGTLQYAADIASSRNGQQMSAKPLQHSWKHEIQEALLRWRAAKTRAVLPNPSAREEWLLAGLEDRALRHWARAPPLDRGYSDDDADTGTDTTTPDDDSEDTATLTGHQSTPLQPPHFEPCSLAPLGLSVHRCTRVTWSLALSTETMAYALKSLPTSLALERAVWPTGEGALASCQILPLLMASHLTSVGLLFKFLTWHSWSDNDARIITLDDILALAASVYMFIQLDPPLPQQRYHRTLPELLAAVAEHLTRQQPSDVPVLHTARAIQQVTRVEFQILEVLGLN